MKMVVFSTICGSGHFNKPLESPKQRGTGRRSCEEVRLRRRRDNLCGYMASFFQFLILQISNILSGRQIKFPISYEETQNEGWKFREIYGNSISRNFHYISSATIVMRQASVTYQRSWFMQLRAHSLQSWAMSARVRQ